MSATTGWIKSRLVIFGQTLVATKFWTVSSLHQTNYLSTDRTCGVKLKPRLDAISMKLMITSRQNPSFVSISKLRETDDTFDALFEVFRIKI
ncbi:hypothetical protein Bca4012_085176 [Brassica carinata]